VGWNTVLGVVAAGLLAGAAIACGATDAEGRLDPGGLRSLQGDWQTFFPAPSVKPTDLLGSCFQQQAVVVPITQTCQLIVRSSKDRVRRAHLAINPGGQARIYLRQPDSITVRRDLNASRPSADLDIFEKGGSLSVSCLASNPCRVSLGE
jgi:hypothetical protein